MSQLNDKTPADEQFLLSSMPPGPNQVRLAGGVLVCLVVALLATAPFARVQLTNTEVLLPAYAAAVLVSEVITAVLLLAYFSVQHSFAVLALAIGYLLTGLLVLPWVLTFPGVFEPMGLLGAGVQSTATIAVVRRIGFPLFVLIYALLKNRSPVTRISSDSARGFMVGSVVAVAALVLGITWFVVAGHGVLPRWMIDARRVSQAWEYVPASATLICLMALVLLWIRRRSMLDLWLMIVLCASLIEIALLAYLSVGRFSVGWWAGRVFGFAAASVVLFVLLAETTSLYVRLARSVEAERRARATRLTTLDAFSASIAHEVNQPLASIVTNADAGLSWLNKQQPNLDEARSALSRIVDDGHRAGKVVASVRSMFKRNPSERIKLDVNDLILEVISCQRSHTRLDRVLVELALDEELPPVLGDPVQLQQVVANLVTNAIEAMGPVKDRARVLRIHSKIEPSSTIVVSVEDSGTGLEVEAKDRLFQPFFTTKPDGMGMGLVFSNSVIEAHGGRIWATENPVHGSTFHFTLPFVDEEAASTMEYLQ